MRIYSKKVTEIFRVFIENQNTFLFAITGDIDNLGVFVANQGRTKAENLVDVYNRIIGDYVYNFYSQNKEELVDIKYIPSGEEIYIIGIAKSREFIENFLNNFSREINSKIIGNEYLYEDYVTISFGYTIFDDNQFILNNVPLFLLLVDENNDKEANLLYLKIQEYIRFILAKNLDEMKFSTLPNSKEFGIGYRNIVFSNMLDYKNRTKQILVDLGVNITKNDELLEKMKCLSEGYGLLDDRKKIVDEIKNLPINNRQV